MSLVRGQRYEDIFYSHYEYLQLAYYKLGDLENACKCTRSYLLFNEKNAMMQQNLKFYAKSASSCETPRPEADSYFKITRYETTLMKFVDQEFTKMYKDLEGVV